MAQAAPLVAAFTVFPIPRVAHLPPPIHVTVDGSVRILEPNTTLGRAARVLGLRPRSGDLVDVEGLPIEKGRFRGYVQVNGVRGVPRTVLADGDQVHVVDARDRLEPVRVKVVPVPEGQIPNPQTHLGTTPGDQIITTGSISGKLVSTVFRPTGAADVPRSVALTFDDGPSAMFTPQILKILKRFDVKATFFMVGSLIERYPDVAEQVVDAGMAVGNHTLGHPKRSAVHQAAHEPDA
ncbi:MAG: polysaccharide deacetylase family protein [Actinomycetota bacterium]